jgi:hypothetical protein
MLQKLGDIFMQVFIENLEFYGNNIDFMLSYICIYYYNIIYMKVHFSVIT